MCATVRRFKESPSSKYRLGSGGITPRAHYSSPRQCRFAPTAGQRVGKAGSLAAEAMDPPEDIPASTALRCDLGRTMVTRALNRAFTR